MIFRISSPIQLCETFPIEKLYTHRNKNSQACSQQETKHIYFLPIIPLVWHLLYGLKECLHDGLRCFHYFELKIKEFLFLLRAYYAKTEINKFFYLILSEDTVFSEYVRLNWNKYPTVNELSNSINMAQKRFSIRFKRIFDITPYQWILEKKAQLIHNQITATNKPFKEIAFENGFGTTAQFSKFCKKMLGKNPSEIRYRKI